MTGAPALTRSVLVVGDGIAALAAAVALKRALPGAAVALVGVPSDPGGWIDRLGAASPAIHRFHRLIGLDPRLFARRAGAEPAHLRRHVRTGAPEMREACTVVIPFVEGVPLHQLWLRHRAETAGAAPDFAAMLLALRDARGEEGGFGMRFDPAAYAALLGEMAAALGVVRHGGAGVAVEVAGGAVARLVTSAGETLTADLYIDAAGPRSHLLTALGAEWHDWSWLPRCALAVEPTGSGAEGEETLAAAADGLRWQTRRWRATVAADAEALAPGRLAHSRQANAVAIGEAAVHAPAADGSLLGAALEDIMRIVALLPRPGGAGRDTNEYVRRTAIAHDALADWSGLNFVADDAARPGSLTEILSAFDARGRVAPRELDPIAPGQWLARLMALRPSPRRIDPTALALPEEIVRTTIARATSQ
jgi:tryptophan halogenase